RRRPEQGAQGRDERVALRAAQAGQQVVARVRLALRTATAVDAELDVVEVRLVGRGRQRQRVQRGEDLLRGRIGWRGQREESCPDRRRRTRAKSVTRASILIDDDTSSWIRVGPYVRHHSPGGGDVVGNNRGLVRGDGLDGAHTPTSASPVRADGAGRGQGH